MTSMQNQFLQQVLISQRKSRENEEEAAARQAKWQNQADATLHGMTGAADVRAFVSTESPD